MKNRKVLRAACHIGAGIQSKLTFTQNGADGKELDGEMDLWPIGVYVHKYSLLIPFTNITSATLAPEAPDAVTPLDEKRGPGRPPRAA